MWQTMSCERHTQTIRPCDWPLHMQHAWGGKDQWTWNAIELETSHEIHMCTKQGKNFHFSANWEDVSCHYPQSSSVLAQGGGRTKIADSTGIWGTQEYHSKTKFPCSCACQIDFSQHCFVWHPQWTDWTKFSMIRQPWFVWLLYLLKRLFIFQLVRTKILGWVFIQADWSLLTSTRSKVQHSLNFIGQA